MTDRVSLVMRESALCSCFVSAFSAAENSLFPQIVNELACGEGSRVHGAKCLAVLAGVA